MATNQIEFSLKIGDLCDRFQISRPTIYRYVAASRKAAAAAAAAGGVDTGAAAAGNFPLPIKFGTAQQSPARWLVADVDAWVAARVAGGECA